MTFCGSSSLTRTSRLVMELDLQSERSGEAPSQSGNRGEAEVVAQVQRARPEVKNGYKMRNGRLGTVKEIKMKKRLKTLTRGSDGTGHDGRLPLPGPVPVDSPGERGLAELLGRQPVQAAVVEERVVGGGGGRDVGDDDLDLGDEGGLGAT